MSSSRFWDRDSDSEEELESVDGDFIDYCIANFKVGKSISTREESAKGENRFVEMEAAAKEMEEAMKKHDWINLEKGFTKINKQLHKATTKSGSESGKKNEVPSVYIKALVQLDDFLYKFMSDKEAKKNLSKDNAKALLSMNKKLGKHNMEYKELMREYRENQKEDGSDSVLEEGKKVEKKEKKKKEFHDAKWYKRRPDSDSESDGDGGPNFESDGDSRARLGHCHCGRYIASLHHF